MSEHPQRGEQEVGQFAAAIIETLNQPKNADKGDWLQESYIILRRGLMEEAHEAWEQAKDMEEYEDERRHQALRDLMAECQDAAASAMFVWDKAKRELEDGE